MAEKVILDTNFLIDLLRFRIDVLKVEELLEKKVEFYMLDKSIDELKSLSKNLGKKGALAKLALVIIKKYKIKILRNSEGKVDDLLFKRAKQGYIIATNDIELRKRIKRLEKNVIYLRGKKEIKMS